MSKADIPEIKAMETLATALEPLNPEERERVLHWATRRYEVSVQRLKQGGVDARDEQHDAEYKHFADFYDAADPKNDAERALVAGYWVQIVEGEATYPSQRLNGMLKDLGHGLSNVTQALTKLKSAKPALASQVKKRGTTAQARKVYKLTTAGIKRVNSMLAADDSAAE